MGGYSNIWTSKVILLAFLLSNFLNCFGSNTVSLHRQHSVANRRMDRATHMSNESNEETSVSKAKHFKLYCHFLNSFPIGITTETTIIQYEQYTNLNGNKNGHFIQIKKL